MGMGGVQRTAKFVKYMPTFGWQPHVLTHTPSFYLAKDECLLHELERISEIKIFRTQGSSEKNLLSHDKVFRFKRDGIRKVLSNASQFFLVPDNKIGWKKKAVELGEKIISGNEIELIYSTAPPYTDFLVAEELKKKSGLPMILDYRDSWYDCPNNFYPTSYHKHLHKKEERRVLEAADKIITINSRIKELIIERYPFVNDEDIVVIPQGYDAEDFEAKDESVRTKMRFTYAGSFMNYYTPKYFLEGLSLAFKTKPEMRDKVEACFVGAMDDELTSLIKEYGLENSVLLSGYVQHSECIKYLLESDVLWMMINKTGRSDLHSTGKLYEYFGAKKPILACVPEGVARKSLDEHGAAIVTSPDNPKEIAEAIIKFYEMKSSGSMPKVNEDYVNLFERKYLTRKLAEEFENVLSETGVMN